MGTSRRGIGLDEYRRRRQQLMHMLGAESAIVLAAAPEAVRSRDILWPYQQNADFQYLCGFPEPHCVLLLLPGRINAEVILFCQERDPVAEALHGKRVGPEDAVHSYGVDDAFPISDIDDILPSMLEGRRRVYYHFGQQVEFDQQLLLWLERLKTLKGGGIVPDEFVDLGHVLHDMRLHKSRSEQRLLQQAADVTVAAHLAAMARIRPGEPEYRIQAEVLHAMHTRGAKASFTPTVATGSNACIAHHVAGASILQAGDMLLLDCGAEVRHYTADVARTYPVSGRFSPAQRTLYDLVWLAQQAALDKALPGYTFADMHEAAVEVLAQGLLDASLLSGDLAQVLETESYKRFYPYKTGHWLGLDVHDVGDYVIDGSSRMLEPGMVFTIEPGLYIPADDAQVPAAYRGMGIRIEDDVLVTRHGRRVLTASLPAEATTIEALLALR